METLPNAEDSPELYLIAHKVRGQPAFDIAHRLQIGDEEGWIIPTSGHRAYPYFAEPLKNFLQIEDRWLRMACLEPSLGVLTTTIDMPTDFPDHYPARSAPTTKPPTGADILRAIGLDKPSAPIRRL